MKILLLLLPINIMAQCLPTPINLPMSDTFCHERLDCDFIFDDAGDPCWECINNPHWYTITPSQDTYVTVTIIPALHAHSLSNTAPQVSGFALFDGCPDDGGQIIFRPWTGASGACWSWDELDIYCGWSQDPNAPNLNQGCVTSTPPYMGFSHNVTMGFELYAGVEYWFCFYPQGGCPPWTYSCTWGCITVYFEGLNFLELVDDSTPPLSTQPLSASPLSTPPRYTKVVIEGRGVFIRDGWTGALYDLITRQQR